MKKPIYNELELTASRFRALSGPTKGSNDLNWSNVASETSYLVQLAYNQRDRQLPTCRLFTDDIALRILSLPLVTILPEPDSKTSAEGFALQCYSIIFERLSYSGHLARLANAYIMFLTGRSAVRILGLPLLAEFLTLGAHVRGLL